MTIIRKIKSEDNASIAEIVRDNLRKYHLDIPGTAFFDPQLSDLCSYYSKAAGCGAYFVAENEDGEILGGIGMEIFSGFEDCCEIQKLYVSDKAKGQGLGQRLLSHIEKYAKENGTKRLYLETHSNLREALCLYEKNGYVKTDRPKEAVHDTMDLFYIKDL